MQQEQQCHLLNPLEFTDITHKLLIDNDDSFESTPIYQWKEKFITVPTENQTPLFLTLNYIKAIFSACCSHIMLNNLPPTFKKQPPSARNSQTHSPYI